MNEDHDLLYHVGYWLDKHYDYRQPPLTHVHVHLLIVFAVFYVLIEALFDGLSGWNLAICSDQRYREKKARAAARGQPLEEIIDYRHARYDRRRAVYQREHDWMSG
jgi:hypothetical protein